MKVRSISLSVLFGLVIFFQKFLFPAPYDKMVSVFIQITLLSLSFLILGFVGPILTSFTSGLITASIRGGLALMTFSFALLYGVLVSVLNYLFGVAKSGQMRESRLVISALISTLLVGLVSLSVSIALGVIPYNPVLVSVIVVSGAVQGLIGGCLSNIIRKRYFLR